MEFDGRMLSAITHSRRAILTGLAGAALAPAVLREAGRRRPAEAQDVATSTTPPAAGSVEELLALLPDPYPSLAADATPLATYADIAGQLAAVGVTAPTLGDEDGGRLWARVTLGLQYPPDLAQFAVQAEVWEPFGWSPFDVDQSLWFGQPPAITTVLRGRFDSDAVEAALLKIGYLPREVPGAVAAFSIEHKDLQLSDPIERFLLTSGLRTLAILPDGTFVWSGHPEGARAVAAVAAGAPSIVRRAPVAELMEAVAEPLASSMLLPGLALAGGFDPLAVTLDPDATSASIDDMATAVAAAEAERRRMPPVGLALFGVTYGGEFVDPEGTPVPLPVDAPPTRHRFYIHVGGRGAAARAVPVIEERLATGGSSVSEQAWSELFQDWSVSVVGERPVVLVEVDPGANRTLWYALLSRRDLGFLAW